MTAIRERERPLAQPRPAPAPFSPEAPSRPHELAAPLAAHPRVVHPREVLTLQRTVGNHAVAALLRARTEASIPRGCVQLVKKKPEKDEDEDVVEPASNRPKREGAFKGSYGDQMQSTGGKPRRPGYIVTGDDPLALALAAVGGKKNKDYYRMLTKHKRRGMSAKFTDQVREDMEARGGDYAKALELPPDELSRNHRLADSVISAIVTVAHYNYTRTESKSTRKAMMTAFENFAEAVANDDKDVPVKKFKQAVGTQGSEVFGLLEQVIGELSVNVWNVRLGDAGRNQEAGNNYDPGVGRDGRMTPRSEGIADAVGGLHVAGLITTDLAKRAVLPAYNSKTDQWISSTVLTGESDAVPFTPSDPAIDISLPVVLHSDSDSSSDDEPMSE